MRMLLLFLLLCPALVTAEALSPPAKQQVKSLYRQALAIESQALNFPATKHSSAPQLAGLKKKADDLYKRQQTQNFPAISTGAEVGFLLTRLGLWIEFREMRSMSADDKSLTPTTLAAMDKNVEESYQSYLKMKQTVADGLK